MILELNQLKKGEVYFLEGDFTFSWYITFLSTDGDCGKSICLDVGYDNNYIDAGPDFGKNYKNFDSYGKISIHTLTLKEYFWFNYCIKNDKVIDLKEFTMDLVKTDEYIDSMILDSIEKTKIFEYVSEI